MKLKNILQFKYVVFFSFAILFVIRILVNECCPNGSRYTGFHEKLYGYVSNISVNKSKIQIELVGLEKVIVNCYVDTYTELQTIISDIKLGDYIVVYGYLKEPDKNTNFNMFNYKLYLERKNIYYTFNMDSYEKIRENSNIFYYLKQKIIERINSLKYSSQYVYSFILGDTLYIDSNVLESYRSIGIGHLFAISGMHINFIIFILSMLFSRLPSYIKNIFIFCFLTFYLFLIDFSLSALRACMFSFALYLNKRFKFDFSSMQLIVLVFLFIIILNPNNLYDVGFQISIIVSFFLVLFSKFINSNKLLGVPFISFVCTVPILIYYFNEINFLSIFVNILCVPLVSYLLFPLSIITFIFPIFDYMLYCLFSLFSWIIQIVNYIDLFKFSFAKPNVFIVIIYYILLFLFYKRRIFITLFFSFLVIHYNILYFNPNIFIYVFDVGQGDAMLIVLPYNKGNILIDTGGKNNYCQSELGCSFYNLSDNLIIPSLKKLGINSLDYLILSHGDYDHMGEAINLVENFKIEKVILNCGEFNDLEQELIKVLDKKKIPYYSCIKELNIDDNKLYFLNSKDYGNENDNSSVIYTELNNYKFLFMGDAGVEVEEDLIKKYNLKDIDVLKVGHHGSKTSSSKEFIDEINPKYSIISVGKNNRYGHPNDSVLDNLEDSKIYRTDQDGSIMFKIKNNKLKIEACIP